MALWFWATQTTPACRAGTPVAELTFTRKTGLVSNVTVLWQEQIPGASDEKQIVTIFCRQEDCPSKGFTDLKQDAWYHDSVDYVLSFGFMKGTSATTFDPNSCATRAAMATVLYRMAGSPQVTGSNPVHRREGRNLVHRGCKLGLRERHREGRNGRTVRSKQSHHPPGSRNYDLPVQWGIPGRGCER